MMMAMTMTMTTMMILKKAVSQEWEGQLTWNEKDVSR